MRRVRRLRLSVEKRGFRLLRLLRRLCRFFVCLRGLSQLLPTGQGARLVHGRDAGGARSAALLGGALFISRVMLGCGNGRVARRSLLGIAQLCGGNIAELLGVARHTRSLSPTLHRFGGHKQQRLLRRIVGGGTRMARQTLAQLLLGDVQGAYGDERRHHDRQDDEDHAAQGVRHTPQKAVVRALLLRCGRSRRLQTLPHLVQGDGHGGGAVQRARRVVARQRKAQVGQAVQLELVGELAAPLAQGVVACKDRAAVQLCDRRVFDDDLRAVNDLKADAPPDLAVRIRPQLGQRSRKRQVDKPRLDIGDDLVGVRIIIGIVRSRGVLAHDVKVDEAVFTHARRRGDGVLHGAEAARRQVEGLAHGGVDLVIDLQRAHQLRTRVAHRHGKTRSLLRGGERLHL